MRAFFSCAVTCSSVVSADGLRCNKQKLLVFECASESAHGLRPRVRLRVGICHAVVCISHSACACPVCILTFPSQGCCEKDATCKFPPLLFFFFMCQTNLRTNILLFNFPQKKKKSVDSWFIAVIYILV